MPLRAHYKRHNSCHPQAWPAGRRLPGWLCLGVSDYRHIPACWLPASASCRLRSSRGGRFQPSRRDGHQLLLLLSPLIGFANILGHVADLLFREPNDPPFDPSAIFSGRWQGLGKWILFRADMREPREFGNVKWPLVANGSHLVNCSYRDIAHTSI